MNVWSGKGTEGSTLIKAAINDREKQKEGRQKEREKEKGNERINQRSHVGRQLINQF
jgi:hypothetical protein